ncbi:MAG: hypothetical protein A3F78_16830 [Burkholderiales bacterium RIFCSPLOWO2_12_FULL_61_40]|nr:MAG: hypothetical protein A3F78_16830 [Burkholderiales bacterium RIFCSPLOWO2_12_FULL_61_40]
MGPLDLLNHVFNFLAPALAVGVLVAMAGQIFRKKVPGARVLPAQAAINCVAGALALGAGLWFFGHDGKMASYAAMVLAVASSQCFLRKGGRA